jgi:hypothetical protein
MIRAFTSCSFLERELDPLPVDYLYGWIRFRLINQPIIAPADLPPENSTI